MEALQHEHLETLDVDKFYDEINANITNESLCSWQWG